MHRTPRPPWPVYGDMVPVQWVYGIWRVVGYPAGTPLPVHTCRDTIAVPHGRHHMHGTTVREVLDHLVIVLTDSTWGRCGTFCHRFDRFIVGRCGTFCHHLPILRTSEWHFLLFSQNTEWYFLLLSQNQMRLLLSSLKTRWAIAAFLKTTKPYETAPTVLKTRLLFSRDLACWLQGNPRP